MKARAMNTVTLNMTIYPKDFIVRIENLGDNSSVIVYTDAGGRDVRNIVSNDEFLKNFQFIKSDSDAIETLREENKIADSFGAKNKSDNEDIDMSTNNKKICIYRSRRKIEDIITIHGSKLVCKQRACSCTGKSPCWMYDSKCEIVTR